MVLYLLRTIKKLEITLKKNNIQPQIVETKDFSYTILRSKIKNIYIHIRDSQVIVKSPMNSSNEYISKLIENKREWITKKLSEQTHNHQMHTYLNGDIIYVLGKPYILKIIDSTQKRNQIYIDGKYLCCKINNEVQEGALVQANVKELIDKYYKFIAKQEVAAAMDDVIERTGLQPQECNIKKLKATWGICSSKKKISINQNLMAYSRHAIEYVCLHEVCHLKYMNHSKEFWNMVEYYMPDYKIAKKELKTII